MNHLLPLYDNYIFKKVFTKDKEILLDLLNSFPQFQAKKKIKKIRILNPEILGSKKKVKDTILDIHAEDLSGSIFLIEMQTNSQEGFSKRILFNWAKLYSMSLNKGKGYKELPKVYSINFLNFSLIKKHSEYIYNFRILENNHPEICLTEDLEVILIELPKLKTKFKDLRDILEYWICLIRDTSKLEEAEMKTIMKKSNGLNKAVKEIKFISLDKESRKLHAAKLNAERKYKQKNKAMYEKGKEKEKEDIAIIMLSKNQSLDFISEITSLSVSQIKALQKKLSK